MKPILAIAAALILAGCATTSQPPPVSVDGFCALGLFYPEEGAEDRWTDLEKRELVTRNETTERLCGIE